MREETTGGAGFDAAQLARSDRARQLLTSPACTYRWIIEKTPNKLVDCDPPFPKLHLQKNAGATAGGASPATLRSTIRGKAVKYRSERFFEVNCPSTCPIPLGNRVFNSVS